MSRNLDDSGVTGDDMKPLRVVAIVSAYNEDDVIGQVIAHLIGEGVLVHFLDDGSTDNTVGVVEQNLGKGVLAIESLARPAGDTPDPVFRWERILRRKEELATQLEADWFIHHDADEFREGPWPGRTLQEAIGVVDRLGYNAIDFAVLNFPPTHDQFHPGDDIRKVFRHHEPAQSFDRLQVKAWKHAAAGVDLVSTAGHDVRFPGRKVFPIRFLLRHYPIRGQRHGERKIFQDRRPRFDPAERARGWHVQYDDVQEGGSFIRDPRTLELFDPEQVRLRLFLRHREMEEFEAAAAAAADRANVRDEARSAALRATENRLALLQAELDARSRELAETRARGERDLVELRRQSEHDLASVRNQAELDLAQARDRAEGELAKVRDRAMRDRQPSICTGCE